MDLEVFTFPQKPTFLFKFSNFSGYTENAPNHILSSNSARQILKMAVKSEPVGLCSRNFWNFLLLVRPSKCKYFKDFKIFDLTWIWWFGLNDPIFLTTIHDQNVSHQQINYKICEQILKAMGRRKIKKLVST